MYRKNAQYDKFFANKTHRGESGVIIALETTISQVISVILPCDNTRAVTEMEYAPCKI